MRIWLSYVEICTKSKTTDSTNDIPIEFSILCNENRQYKKKGLSSQARETLSSIYNSNKSPYPQYSIIPLYNRFYYLLSPATNFSLPFHFLPKARVNVWVFGPSGEHLNRLLCIGPLVETNRTWVPINKTSNLSF